MKTWSDVLEELRAKHGDTSEYDWIVPIQLLNSTFQPTFANEQFRRWSANNTLHGLQVAAWSSSHIYVLIYDSADNQYLDAVRRNPPA